MSAVVHACPPGDSAVAPCCGRSMLELPHHDRVTLDPLAVTCMTGDDPRLTGRVQ